MLGLERFICKSLPAAFSNLFIQSTALLCPFALVLAKAVWPNNDSQPEDRKALQNYWDLLFINFGQPFGLNDLNKVIMTYIEEHLKVKMTIRWWQHIIIGFRRLLKVAPPSLYKDLQMPEIDQAGHSCLTNIHRYAVMKNVPIGVDADRMNPMIEASRNWQHALHIVPGMCRFYLFSTYY
jgi:hypothetical protein